MYKVYGYEVDGKIVYIGRTKVPLRHRWWDSVKRANSGSTKMRLYQGIRDIGKENFKIVEFGQFEFKEDADAFEVKLVQKYNTIAEGFNTAKGGSGCPIKRPDVIKYNQLPETRKKRSEGNRRRYVSDETRAKMSASHRKK